MRSTDEGPTAQRHGATHRRRAAGASAGRARLGSTVGLALALVGALVAALLVAPAVAAEAASSGAEFDAPSGLAFGGGHLWVTNQAGSSVTEINPANGSWVRTVRAASYGLVHPTAIASAGGDLWITNASGSVTEMRASDGALVRRISGRRYGFNRPVAVKADGGTILVLNQGGAAGGSVTELWAATGALRHLIVGSRFAFAHPVALAAAGADVFVADAGNNTVTEVQLASGGLVRRITNPGLRTPDGIGSGNGHVWVADQATSAVTEIAAGNGSVLGTISNSAYGFGHPTVTMQYEGSMFVATPLGTSPMVTRFSASTGALSWFMCNNNGPYYFSQLSAFAASGDHLWVASRSGANYHPPTAAPHGSLTEMNAVTGQLIRTIP